jgi:hypothetical protein
MKLPSDLKDLLEEFAREGVEQDLANVVELERVQDRLRR